MFRLIFAENRNMKSISAVAALALFSLLVFGSGVFLHISPPVQPASAVPVKPVAVSHQGKKKPAPKTAAPKPAVPGTRNAGTENPLVFPLMTAGGMGLLLSALAALGLTRAAVPAARRLLDAAAAERRKQQEEFEAHNAGLQTQLHEAKARKAEAEAQREQVSRQFQEFFRTLPVPCFCFAASGKIILWNAACELLYGISSAAALDSTLWDTIIPASEREETEAKIQRVLAGESLHDTERWDTVAGGEPARLRCSMVPVYDAGGHIVGGLSAGVEVPEIALYEQQIAALAGTPDVVPQPAVPVVLDKATLREQIEQIGQAELSSQMLEKIITSAAQASAVSEAPPAELSGHPAFRARLAEEIARAARYHGQLSLIVLDLDGFTARNQQFGFEAGDQALQSAAAVIKSKIRTVDALVHLGADEYALILPETGESGARVAAERMRTGLAGTSIAGGQPLQTACFGVVQLTPDIQNASEMIYRGQSALAAAQRCGVNSVMHYQDLPQQNLPQEELASSQA